MINEHRVRSATNTMNSWVARRTANGKHPNADEIAEHIRTTWPTLTPEEREAVFQRMKE